jgi:hypothetical protein
MTVVFFVDAQAPARNLRKANLIFKPSLESLKKIPTQKTTTKPETNLQTETRIMKRMTFSIRFPATHSTSNKALTIV